MIKSGISVRNVFSIMMFSMVLLLYCSLPSLASVNNKKTGSGSKVSTQLSNKEKLEKSVKTSSPKEIDSLQSDIQAYMDFRYNRQKQLTKWAKGRVKSLKGKLKKVESRAKKLDRTGKKNWKEEVLPSLKAQKKTLDNRFKELKRSSKEFWIHVKWAFGEALERYELNLNKALEKVIEAENSSKEETN